MLLLQGGPGGLTIGLVDMDMRCSTILLKYGATWAAHQPGELSKCMSRQPNCQTTRVTL